MKNGCSGEFVSGPAVFGLYAFSDVAAAGFPPIRCADPSAADKVTGCGR